ncbi:MAG: hypothetical protein ACD_79C00223G0001, partial [uncultured bacterium]
LKGKLIQDLDSLTKLAKANLFTWEDLYNENNKEISEYIFDESKLKNDKKFLEKTAELFIALGLNIDVWHNGVFMKGNINPRKFGDWIIKFSTENIDHLQSFPFYKMLDNFKTFSADEVIGKYYEDYFVFYGKFHTNRKNYLYPDYFEAKIFSKCSSRVLHSQSVLENATGDDVEYAIQNINLLAAQEDLTWESVYVNELPENIRQSLNLPPEVKTMLDWIMYQIKNTTDDEIKAEYFNLLASIKDLKWENFNQFETLEHAGSFFNWLIAELQMAKSEKVAKSIVNVMLKSNELTPERVELTTKEFSLIKDVIVDLEKRCPEAAMLLADIFKREKGLKINFEIENFDVVEYFNIALKGAEGALQKIYINLFSQVETLIIQNIIKDTNAVMSIGQDNPLYESVIEGLRNQFANGEEPSFAIMLDALQEINELQYEYNASEGESKPVIQKIIQDAVDRSIHGAKKEYKNFKKLKENDAGYNDAKEQWEKVTSKDSLVILLKVLSKSKTLTLKVLKEKVISAMYDPMVGDWEYTIFEWIKKLIDVSKTDVPLRDAPPNIRIFILDLLNKFEGVSVKEFDKEDYEILDAVWTWTLNDENSEVKLTGLQWFINLKDLDLEFFTKEEIHNLLESLINECKDEKVLKKCYELFCKVLKEGEQFRNKKLDAQINALENELAENDSQIEAISKALNKIVQKIKENEKLEDSIRSMKLKSDVITPKHVALLFKEDIKLLQHFLIEDLIMAAGLYFTWEDLLKEENRNLFNNIFHEESIKSNPEYRQKFADLLIAFGLDLKMLNTTLPGKDSTLMMWLETILKESKVNDNPNIDPLCNLFTKVKPEKMENLIKQFISDKALLEFFFKPNSQGILPTQILLINLLSTVEDLSIEYLEKHFFINSLNGTITFYMDFIKYKCLHGTTYEKVLYLNLLSSLKDFNFERFKDLATETSSENFITLLTDMPSNTPPEQRIAVYKTLASLKNLTFEELLDITSFDNLTSLLAWIKNRIEIEIKIFNDPNAALEASKIVESIV